MAVVHSSAEEVVVRRPQLLVFDLDGTLVDSFPGIHRALGLALAELGRPPRDLGWVRRHVGRGVRALMVDAADGLDPDHLLERFRLHYDAVVLEQTPAYPGVGDMLAALAPAHLLAIASNKPHRWVAGLIEHLGWSPLFAAVADPETAGVHKPDPSMVLAVLRRLGVAPERALLVGDMPIDARTGRNAGVPVVGVTTGVADEATLRQAGCIAVLDSAASLPAWLDRIAAPPA